VGRGGELDAAAQRHVVKAAARAGLTGDVIDSVRLIPVDADSVKEKGGLVRLGRRRVKEE
jgi:hypothetical protein